MKNKFPHQFILLMISIGKGIGLAVLCGCIACAVVWPLWKWATVSPASYTFTVLAAALCAAIIALVRTVRRTSAGKVISFITYFLIIAGGCAGAVALVFRGHRILAVLTVIALPVLCAGCSAVFSRLSTHTVQTRRAR